MLPTYEYVLHADGGPHDYHSGSWVDLHNPDLNVCDDNPSCDGAFRDLDGDLVRLLQITEGVPKYMYCMY